MRKILKYLYVLVAVYYFIDSIIKVIGDFSFNSILHFLISLELIFIAGYLVFAWNSTETDNELGIFDAVINVFMFIIKAGYIIIALAFVVTAFEAIISDFSWDNLWGEILIGIPIVSAGIALFLKNDD